MNKPALSPIFAAPASLWDGATQLSGTLELWDATVIFRLEDFGQSHLNLTISLMEIEKAEEFLVFDLARNGLRIKNRDGRSDLFVLEEGQTFKQAILRQMRSVSLTG